MRHYGDQFRDVTLPEDWGITYISTKLKAMARSHVISGWFVYFQLGSGWPGFPQHRSSPLRLGPRCPVFVSQPPCGLSARAAEPIQSRNTMISITRRTMV